jgi:predicted hotdog family 3-hydroxylacyl-ACP dehydratase
MRLLHRVLEHGPEGAACEARASDAAIFRDAAGRIPAWVAIEWMAQCAGIQGALLVLARGEKPGLGFLTGGRAVRLLVPFLPEDVSVRVEARPAGSAAGLHSFACRVVTEAGALLAEGRLGIFVPQLSTKREAP